MPYEEEEDRVCEVKCPKGGGVCDNGATAILLLLLKAECDYFLKIALMMAAPILRSSPLLVSGMPVFFEICCLAFVMPKARFQEKLSPGIFIGGRRGEEYREQSTDNR